MSLSDILKNRNKVLGMNERNLIYVRKYNPAKFKKIADDKILTKKILELNGIPTPKLIAKIETFKKFQKFDWSILPSSFVIKPVRGTEGAGIEIFYNQDKEGNWIKADKSKYSLDDIKKLAGEILDGKYTPYSDPDSVLIEERVRSHKAFKYFTFKGTPDVRIVVFNSIPVMSYVRLPTKASEGKANLAQGAIGAGIDLSNGTTTDAVYGKAKGGRGEFIDTVPGTKISLSGLKIPYWDKMLEIAVRCQMVTKIGFLAVDFLIDRDEGPKVVELTARPGLSIQIANQAGLKARLVKAGGIKVKTPEQAVRLAKDLFGGEIEEDIERISGKQLIGIFENINLYGINGEEVETKAKIDTGADSTSIDKELAIALGYGTIIEDFEKLPLPNEVTKEEGNKLVQQYKQTFIEKYEYFRDFDLIKSSHGMSFRIKIEIKMKLGDLVYDTNANIFDRQKLSYKVIVGRKSLSKFLIEPSKTKE